MLVSQLQGGLQRDQDSVFQLFVAYLANNRVLLGQDSHSVLLFAGHGAILLLVQELRGMKSATARQTTDLKSFLRRSSVNINPHLRWVTELTADERGRNFLSLWESSKAEWL